MSTTSPGQQEGNCRLETVVGFPDLLGLHDSNPQRYPFLLESVAHGTTEARYDILFAFPGASLQLDSDNTLAATSIQVEGNDFLANLDNWWQAERESTHQDIDLPFRGGWFVYLGYELAGQVEPSLVLPRPASNTITAYAARIPAAIIRDHVTQRCWLIAESGHEDRIDVMRDDIANLAGTADIDTNVNVKSIAEEEPASYLSAVERIRDYIVEGDVFQVNLSRQWHVELADGASNASLYAALRNNNPAPFAGLADIGEQTIISSSPERLVSSHREVVETRPIAGTRPRGSELDTDKQLSGELLAHPKERAEHIMLIDLERNDLGRICKPGTINVNELMVLESYAHVHHIVSNVRGRLREGTTPGEVIRAVFPGGTITGCPKVRCMAIIAELERAPRGAYTGSMGYLNRDGDMDLNILIRTMTREHNTLTLRAGAGIVADSVADNELAETRAKAKGLLAALGIAT